MSVLKVDGLRHVDHGGDSDSIVLKSDGSVRAPNNVSTPTLEVGTLTGLNSSVDSAALIVNDDGTLLTSYGLTVSGSLTSGGLTFPTADGDALQFIQTDGSGNLAFGSAIMDKSVDGGSASSVYLISQNTDGGSASG
jgi:hypothetical protein